MLKDILVLAFITLVYTFVMFGAGVTIERHYVERILPGIQTRAYIKGIKDCQQFEKNQEQRDLVQADETQRFIKIYDDTHATQK